jgi:hypothetical protein
MTSLVRAAGSYLAGFSIPDQRVDRPALELILAHVRPAEPQPDVQRLEEQLERARRRRRVGPPDDRPVKLVLLRSTRRHPDNLSAGDRELRRDPLGRL